VLTFQSRFILGTRIWDREGETGWRSDESGKGRREGISGDEGIAKLVARRRRGVAFSIDSSRRIVRSAKNLRVNVENNVALVRWKIREEFVVNR